mmetsp:Transcript_7648/g.14030  ORF Transcript_7648/g.14030 Transcript_7648/m.14030 type:complete len:302 (+) Transcript_7648:232-1137(+)
MENEVADGQQLLSLVNLLEEQVRELEVATRLAESSGLCTLDLACRGFDRLVNSQGVRGQTLEAAFVLVVGVGNIGSLLVDGLARAGIGAVGVLDRGEVRTHEVSGGVFGMQHVGVNKADCIKRVVQLVNPLVQVHACTADVTKTNRETYPLSELCLSMGCGKPDLVVCCIKGAEQRLSTASWCLQNNVPLTDLETSSQLGDVSVRTFAKGFQKSCLRCYKAQRSGEPQDENKDFHDAFLPATNLLVAGLLLQQVIKALSLDFPADAECSHISRYSVLKDMFEVTPLSGLMSCKCDASPPPK